MAWNPTAVDTHGAGSKVHHHKAEERYEGGCLQQAEYGSKHVLARKAGLSGAVIPDADRHGFLPALRCPDQGDLLIRHQPDRARIEGHHDLQDLVAWNMRRLRVERGLSQEKLAIDAGVDRTYVSRLERRLENPSIGVFEKLALTSETSLAALFVEPDPNGAAHKPIRAGRKPKV